MPSGLVLTIRQLASVSVPWKTFRARFGPLTTYEAIAGINRQVVIASLIDWYDAGHYEYAFTSAPAALEFCRRHERGLVELCRPYHAGVDEFLAAFKKDGRLVPPREKYPEYANMDGWTSRLDDIAFFISHPANLPWHLNHQEVLDHFGCGATWDAYLEEQRRLARPGWERDCWCACLRAGIVPPDNLIPHARNFDSDHAEDMFNTDQHDGRLRRMTCKVCQSLVLQLSLGVPGFGDSNHACYTFPKEEDLPGLTPANYEAYLNSHPGIHCDGWNCTFYQTTKVHDLGFESGE